MEFQFDPELGEAVQISSRSGNQLDKAFTSDEDFDRKQQQRVDSFTEKTAQGLANRNKGGHIDFVDNRDNKLNDLVQQMAQAQRNGDHVRIQRLEAVLDGLTTGQMDIDENGKGVKPQQTQTEANKPRAAIKKSDQISSTTQPSRQEFEQLETFQEIHNKYGDEAEEIFEFINEHGSEADAKAVLGDNIDDAVTVMEMSKLRLQQQKRGIQGGKVGFNEAQAEALYADTPQAREVVRLSNAVAAGEISQQAAMAEAMKDPQVLAAAAKLMSEGRIAFGN